MTTQIQHDRDFRRIEMHTLHESLARERMRSRMQDAHEARQAQLASQVAAAHRWHRVLLWAGAAEARHARRVRELSLG
jgi:hypothetical protein